MKKWKRAVIVTILSVIVLITALLTCLDFIIISAVEGIGPRVTGAPVRLKSVTTHLLFGYVKLEGLEVGNPEGFSAPDALTVKKIVFDLDPSTLFSGKIEIEELTVDGVDIYYEQKLSTNNISVLNDNVKKFQESILGKADDGKKDAPAEEPETAPDENPQKLQIDQLTIKNIYVDLVVTGKASAPLPVAYIVLENLGKDDDGVTAADVLAACMDKLTLGALSAISDAVKKGMISAASAVSDAGKATGKAIEKGFDKTAEAIDSTGKAIKKIFE